MNSLNIQFKAISLNVRGIRTFEKRKAILNWLLKQNADVCFLQETYSTEEVETQWKKQWRGEMYFSHGSNHSRGVMVMVKNTLDFRLNSLRIDEQGRSIILDANIQDTPFLLVNIYAPNTTNEQITFFETLRKQMEVFDNKADYKILMGGDYNIVLDTTLDSSGGNPLRKNSVPVLENMMLENDLVDIWRIRNPVTKRFTWRQKSPIIQRRLDYWIVSDILQDDVEKVEISTAIKTDHSAIVLEINTLKEQPRGPSFWKFNNSLLDDENYVKLITENIPLWYEEIEEARDVRVKWDWLKYKIRYHTIKYSKQQAKKRREQLRNIEKQLEIDEKILADSPTAENLEKLENTKTEYEKTYDYIVKGSIIRSRATWYEKGEKNNKYFLNLENSKKKKSCIRKLILQNGIETTSPKTIMEEIKSFYSKLYSDETPNAINELTCPFLNSPNIPKLSNTKKNLCEGNLTRAECWNVLSSFANNKTPGNDGLTIEFYKVFWKDIGSLLVECLNFSHKYGELSTSQKQAIIILIEKENKDRRLIKNWRPISLINVDVKIGSKAIAKRLESVLPDLVHYNQTAYVKGRTIFDAVRIIDDVINFTELKNQPGLLVTIDFEKAFDSIKWEFLINTLKTFNFGPSIISWIKTFYKNISSCVNNNGFSTNYFELKRGVRQGDPLSPYLFILCLELLAIEIRKNGEIKGLLIGNEDIKLTTFADDMTCFLKNTASYHKLLNVLEEYGLFSGLKVNKEKTEFLLLGNINVSSEELGGAEIKNKVKILGIYFTHDWALFKKLNFDAIVKSIKKTFSAWRWRNLTLLGKIQIIKSFVIPKILHRAAVLPCENDFIKELNQLLFEFLWGGRDKIKRTAMINEIEYGGLKMPDVESLIKTQRIMCIKKYLESYESSWKKVLSYYLKKVGGPFLFHCHFEYSSLSLALPTFYRHCVNVWSALRQDEPTTPEKIAREILWNNKFIRLENKSVYNQQLLEKGLVTVGDLFDQKGILRHGKQLFTNDCSPLENYLTFCLFNAIPLDWRNKMKEFGIQNRDCVSLNRNSIFLRIGGEIINLPKFQSKLIYKRLVSEKATTPTAVTRYSTIYNNEVFQLEWKKIFALPFKTTLHTKLREFQFKILNRILFTNSLLFKIGKVDSPLCYFCKKENETPEHLFFSCQIIREFWNDVHSTLNNLKITLDPLDIKDVFFGIYGKSEHSLLINHFILYGKFFIHYCKISKTPLSQQLFIKRIKLSQNTEYIIAKEKNNLKYHNKKWDAFSQQVKNN